MENKLPVSVIIVSFNTKDLTRKALQALYNSSRLPEQVIVVDNNSQDGSAQMIKEEFPHVLLIESKENLGFAKGNNLGIKTYVNQPYVWLLNSDTETGKHSLQQLLEYMEQHPEVGALGPQMVYPTREFQSVGGYFPSIANVFYYLLPFVFFIPKSWRRQLKSIAVFPRPLPDKALDLDYVTGAASLLRRKALDEVGLMPEDYFMYFEETDMCYRMKKAGWKIQAINCEPVMHVYGGSFKTKYDPRRLQLFQESLIKFVKKNYTGWRRFAIMAEVFLFGSISIFVKKFKEKL
ncbi:MAG: glycosyltransferase family 2 protein [Candidatus Magasanikbacteria bacterium]|nr:glycosyltransferase family 2 protein [Candidatus Magasanikbacteria bacterium]